MRAFLHDGHYLIVRLDKRNLLNASMTILLCYLIEKIWQWQKEELKNLSHHEHMLFLELLSVQKCQVHRMAKLEYMFK